MSVLKRTCAKLLSVFRKTELDHDFDEEAQSHIALATDDSVQRGMPLAEAHRLARLRFGSIAASKDAHRDSRGLPWLDGFLFDLRLAVRGLRRDRAFALTSITLMALAIGLNVTVFTVMDAMLFRGYPLVNGNDRLVCLQERSASGTCCISYPDFEDWRAQAQSFQGMAFVASNRPISFRDSDGRPSDLLTLRVSANTFGLLGVPPMLGRDFVAADEDSGAAQVAILNHRFWDSRFARRPDIVGVTVQINGAPATIVGVMPEGFDFPMQETLWMPVSRTSEWLQRGPTPGGFMVVGRLKPNTSLEVARAELETINRRLEASYPATNRGVIPWVANYSQIVKSAGLRTFEIEGRISTAGGEESVAVVRAGSGYFRVLGVSVISGRDFNDGDHASAPPVAIVNESFAAKFLPGEQPLGQRLRARDRSTNAEWRVVTGVVPNIMQGDPTRQNFKPLVYVPFRQEASTSSAYLLVRTSLPPAQVAQAVRSEVQAVDPDVHLANFTTLEASFAFDRDSMDAAHSELGKYATVAPTFAAIAVVLSTIGLYAIIAHSIGQRTKEFAVRMAIGAAAEDIRWMVLRDGMAPVAVGVIAGLAASLGVNRLLQSQLVGVSPSDAVSVAGASLGLLLVALFACLNPARRAMNVAPAVALRHE